MGANDEANPPPEADQEHCFLIEYRDSGLARLRSRLTGTDREKPGSLLVGLSLAGLPVALAAVLAWLISVLLATLPASAAILAASFLPEWIVLSALGLGGCYLFVNASLLGLSQISLFLGKQLDPLDRIPVPAVPKVYVEVFPRIAGLQIAKNLASLGGVVLGVLLVRAGNYGWAGWWGGIQWTLLSSVDTMLLNLPTQLGFENPAPFAQDDDWPAAKWLVSTLVAVGTVTYALFTIGNDLIMNEVFYGTREGVRQYVDRSRPRERVVVFETASVMRLPEPFPRTERQRLGGWDQEHARTAGNIPSAPL